MTNTIASANHTHSNRCWWNPEQATWVCSGSLDATSAAARASVTEPGPPLVDIRDMLVVHTALLREFRLAPAAVTRVPAGDVRRAATVDRHLGFVCDLLHHHHEGEDELLWPRLRDRVGPAAVRYLEAAQAQHTALDAALARVASARTDWLADPSAERRSFLASELAGLHELLAEHLDLEERAVLPLAAAALTAAEWHAVGEAAVEAMPKPDLALAFGMFAYEGDPEVLRSMLQSAPLVPRVLLPRIAPRLYARRARAVHGTPTP